MMILQNDCRQYRLIVIDHEKSIQLIQYCIIEIWLVENLLFKKSVSCRAASVFANDKWLLI